MPIICDAHGDPVTEERWKLVEGAIRRFRAIYPRHWKRWTDEMDANRTQYGLAVEKGALRSAGWRNTASFPVIYRHATEDDGLIGKEDDDLVQVSSLKEVIEVLIPGFLASDGDVSDRNGALSARVKKKNALYYEFLRRFPVFKAGEHI